MQLGNNRVWDYAGDNYVHRLVQNKGDGKLVEVSDESNTDPSHDEKFDSITLEVSDSLRKLNHMSDLNVDENECHREFVRCGYKKANLFPTHLRQPRENVLHSS